MAKPDWQFVQVILDRTEGKGNAERAKEITKKLGKRIRQRRREDAASTKPPQREIHP